MSMHISGLVHLTTSGPTSTGIGSFDGKFVSTPLSEASDLSLVLPCYNEAATIHWLVERARASRPATLRFQLVIVDNGSSDDTPSVVAQLMARPEYAFVTHVPVIRNTGYGNGISEGLKAATGRVVGWSHADRQCDPADVFRAYEQLQHAEDVRRTLVKGRRQRRNAQAMTLTLGMQAAARLVLRLPLSDINAQPKIFDRALLADLVHPPRDFNFDLYVLAVALRHGWRIETVDVHFGRRAHGQSRWAFGLRSRARHIIGALRYMNQLRQTSL